MPVKKILVVDDEIFFREVFKDALQERFQVMEASSGHEALELAASHTPDLIVLDIEMPDINGIQVCRELKNRVETRHIPVLLLSARTEKEEIVLGLQAGADDYLTKPMCLPEIIARIDAHLRSKGFYADLEHRDLLMLLELTESLTVLRNPMKILRLIVEMVAKGVEASRCSIVTFSSDRELIVKASSDLDKDEEICLQMDRYPEICQALKTRSTVVVNDIMNDPLMETVRQYMTGLDFNSIIVIPIIKKEGVIGTFFLRTASNFKGGIPRRVYNLCHLVANISANALENAILFESMRTAQEFLEEMAIRDGLTNLYSHRHFYDRLEEEFSRSARHHEPLSLIFFDIDDFKRINDNFGHTRGDEVLRQIGRCIKQVVRDSDIPARYGGEEFALLLPNTSTAGAQEMARRLGSIIRSQRYGGLPGESVTVSIGVSTFTNDNLETYSQLVEHADTAMYRAKNQGKDQIAIAD